MPQPSRSSLRKLHDRLNALSAAADRLGRQGTRAPAILQQLLDDLPFAALVADNAGQYVFTNRAAASLTGYSPAELRRLSVWQLTPSVHEHEAEVLWRAFIEQGTQTGSYAVLRKGGQVITTAYAAKANLLPGWHLSLLQVSTSRSSRSPDPCKADI